MSYLLSQIFFCLLLAFACGVVVGFLACRLYCKCQKNEATQPQKAASPVASAIKNTERSESYNPRVDVPAYLSGDEYSIETLEGIGRQTGNMFRDYGIATIADYLCKLYDPASREAAANELNVRVKPLHDWASMCDLMRVPSINHQDAELAHAAGINEVGDLARADAQQLHDAMVQVNEAGKKRISPDVPDLDQVAQWIDEAQNVNALVRSV